MTRLLLGALIAGCVASSGVVATAPRPQPPAIALHADPSGVPIVTAMVDGLPLDLLLDSGANAHVLLAPVVQLVGGAVRDGKAIGRVDDVHAVLGDHVLDSIIQLPMLDVLTKRRLAGLVSPWRWAREGVRIDLVRGELSFGRPPLPGPPSFTGRFVKCDKEDFTSPTAVVDVEIAGHLRHLEVDTGSTRTVLDTAAARELPTGEALPIERMTGIVAARRVDDVDARAGSLHRRLAIGVMDVPALACAPTEGTLGIDMLSGCVLDADRDTLIAHCGEPVTLAPLAPAADRIRIAALEIEPVCGVDAVALQRAAHPAVPWQFHDWGDTLIALVADERSADLARASVTITRACRDAGTPKPDYRLHWRTTPEGLVLRYLP